MHTRNRLVAVVEHLYDLLDVPTRTLLCPASLKRSANGTRLLPRNPEAAVGATHLCPVEVKLTGNAIKFATGV